MSDFQFAVLMATIVKVVVVAAGLTIALFGFKLFVAGVQRGGAAANAEGLGLALRVDRGGPGLVFCVFGCTVLLVGILKNIAVSGPHHTGFVSPSAAPPRGAAPENSSAVARATEAADTAPQASSSERFPQ